MPINLRYAGRGSAAARLVAPPTSTSGRTLLALLSLGNVFALPIFILLQADTSGAASALEAFGDVAALDVADDAAAWASANEELVLLLAAFYTVLIPPRAVDATRGLRELSFLVKMLIIVSTDLRPS